MSTKTPKHNQETTPKNGADHETVPKPKNGPAPQKTTPRHQTPPKSGSALPKNGGASQKTAPRVVSARTKQQVAASKEKAGTPQRRSRRQRGWRGLSVGTKAAVLVGGAVIILAVIYVVTQLGGNQAGGQYPYVVGSPGPGAQAPEIALPSTTGGAFDLSAQRGKTVLLYFQEGLSCEPCWTQLKDIQTNQSQFQGLGIDQIVTITTNPLDQLQQKVRDEGISLPVLSDTDLKVSGAYGANQYGMMGSSTDGHTFIVVGPDGKIRWRGDFGGASTNNIMYVPISNLIADLRKGLSGASS